MAGSGVRAVWRAAACVVLTAGVAGVAPGGLSRGDRGEVEVMGRWVERGIASELTSGPYVVAYVADGTPGTIPGRARLLREPKSAGPTAVEAWAAQSPATAPAGGPASRPRRFAVGTKIEADEHATGRFIPGVVKRVGKAHYYVGFDGWSDTFDKWLPFDQVRAREPGKVYETPRPTPRMPNERPRPVPPEPVTADAGAVEVRRDPGGATAAGGSAGGSAGDSSGGGAGSEGGAGGVTDGGAGATTAPAEAGAGREGTIAVDASNAVGGFEPDGRGAVRPLRPVELRAYEQNNARRLSFEGMLRGPEIVDVMVVAHRGSDPKAAFGSWFYRLETVDLSAGKSVGTVDLPGGMKPISVSGDGRRLAAVSEGTGRRNGEVVGFYELRPAAVKPLARFAPFGSGTAVAFAVPVGEDRLAAATGDGAVAVFEVKAGPRPEAATVRAVWESPAPAQGALSPVAFSSNLKHIAVHRSGGIAVLRTSDGACVARIENVPVGSVSWAPDGTKLAVVQGAVLSVYDLKAGGERVMKVATSLETATSHLTTIWLADDLVVVDAETVVEVSSGLPVWRLKLPDAGGPAMGVGANVVTAKAERDAKGVRTRLNPVALPVDQMRAVAKGAGPEAFDYRPGDAVRLEVSHEDDSARKAIEASVRKWLAAEGIKVRDDAKSVLKASVAGGPSRQQRMRNMRTGQETEVTIPSRVARLEWSLGGKSVSVQERRYEASGLVQAREGTDVNAEVRKTLPSGEEFFTGARAPLDTAIPKAEWLTPKGETRVE